MLIFSVCPRHHCKGLSAEALVTEPSLNILTLEKGNTSKIVAGFSNQYREFFGILEVTLHFHVTGRKPWRGVDGKKELIFLTPIHTGSAYQDVER